MSLIDRPEAAEYGDYYDSYVSKVPEGDIVDILVSQKQSTARFLASISEEKSLFRYAPEKWSIRDVVMHLADAERLFLSRAVRIARCDQTPLPGFDENEYAATADADRHSLSELATDFACARDSSISFFQMISDEESRRTGIASNNPFSVRSFAFINAGHELHHVGVIRDRYL